DDMCAYFNVCLCFLSLVLRRSLPSKMPQRLSTFPACLGSRSCPPAVRLYHARFSARYGNVTVGAALNAAHEKSCALTTLFLSLVVAATQYATCNCCVSAATSQRATAFECGAQQIAAADHHPATRAAGG